MPQERPDDSDHLGSERNHDCIGVSAREKTSQPLAEPGIATAQCRQDRTRALYQHLARVLAAAFGDANRRGFPPVVACREQARARQQGLGPARRSERPTAAASAVALRAPIPGMLVSRRADSFCFASAINSASNMAKRSFVERAVLRYFSTKRLEVALPRTVGSGAASRPAPSG